MPSNALITRLAVVFGVPEHTTDPKAYMDELARLTRSYSEAEQNRAADDLIRSHKPTRTKPWPTPHDICEACISAREALTQPKVEPEKWRDWSAGARRKAVDLIRCDLGQAAAEQGWITSLWDFCRKQGRLPNEAEAHRCRVMAKEFDEAYRSFCTNPGVPAMALAIKKGFEERFARRDLLSRAAYGEVVEGLE